MKKIVRLWRRFPAEDDSENSEWIQAISDEADKFAEVFGEPGISIAQLRPIIGRCRTPADSAAIMEWAENCARVGPRGGKCSVPRVVCFEKVTDQIVEKWEYFWTDGFWDDPCRMFLGGSILCLLACGMTVALTVFYIVGLGGIFEWARDASSGNGSCPPGVWIYTVAALILVGVNGFCYCSEIFFDADPWNGDYGDPLLPGSGIRYGGNEWAFSGRGIIQFCFSFPLAIWGSVEISQVDESQIAAMNCSKEHLANRWNCEPGETQIFVECRDLWLYTFTQVVTYFYFAMLVLLCCASMPPSYRGCGERR